MYRFSLKIKKKKRDFKMRCHTEVMGTMPLSALGSDSSPRKCCHHTLRHFLFLSVCPPRWGCPLLLGYPARGSWSQPATRWAHAEGEFDLARLGSTTGAKKKQQTAYGILTTPPPRCWGQHTGQPWPEQWDSALRWEFKHPRAEQGLAFSSPES